MEMTSKINANSTVVKILYQTGDSGVDKFMLALAREIEKKGKFESFFVNIFPRHNDFMNEHGIGKANNFFINYSKQKAISKPDMKFLEHCERIYDFRIWDLWNINAQRNKKRDKIDPNQILCSFEFVLREYEKLMDSLKPDMLIMFSPAGYESALLYYIAKAKGVKVMLPISARTENKFAVKDNTESLWPILRKEYILKVVGISEEEDKRADKFIQDFRIKKPAPDVPSKYKASFKDKIKKFRELFSVALRYKQVPDLRFIGWKIREIYYKKFFEKPRDGEKYLLYPLHFQPEASTSLNGKWFENQINLTEILSKALPVGYKLYVVEHSVCYGRRPTYFHQQIRRLRNVRLISPKVNALEMIKNCSMLITISGTAGWEAILYQKPVITFGHVYYNEFKEVLRPVDLEQLPYLLRENLDKTISYLEVKKFIAAYLASIYDGLLRMPGDCNNKSLDPVNIENLANGIVRYINTEI